MDDTIHGARDVTKTNTLRVDAFASPMSGPLGRVDGDGRVVITSRPARGASLRGAFADADLRALPRVDVVASYQGADGALIDAAVAAGARGHRQRRHRRRLPDAAARSRRSSARPPPASSSSRHRASALAASRRVPALLARGWIAADDLLPWKARILLRLALASGEDIPTIRARFSAT